MDKDASGAFAHAPALMLAVIGSASNNIGKVGASLRCLFSSFLEA